MHTFSTTLGKEVKDNRISLWSLDREQQAYPALRFKAPTTIDTNRIRMFTIKITQQCNLRCSYCCYSGSYRDRRAHNEKRHNRFWFEILL